jgi:hypothetical protein
MKQPDPLLKPNAEADRLHYATGELLGADDFRDEQTYHRRQLARALLFLHGSGTIAGLRVVARHLPGSGPSLHDVQLEVEPGLALDRAGRLIEVPRPACLRLRRWYEFIENQPPESDGLDVDDLRTAFHLGNGVVADIYLTFHPCDRGYTPAFASGPFDALDASQPSRVRDAYELSLVPRPEANPLTAFDPWAEIHDAAPADRLEVAQQANLNAWTMLAIPPPDTVPEAQNPAGVDPTAVLLARLTIPAAPAPDGDSAPVPNWSAGSWPAPTPPPPDPVEVTPNVENTVRNFLLPPAALRHLLSP